MRGGKMRKVRFLILMILSVLSLNSCLLATAAEQEQEHIMEITVTNNRSATSSWW